MIQKYYLTYIHNVTFEFQRNLLFWKKEVHAEGTEKFVQSSEY